MEHVARLLDRSERSVERDLGMVREPAVGDVLQLSDAALLMARLEEGLVGLWIVEANEKEVDLQ